VNIIKNVTGIILTSKEAQCKLLRELYEEANVNPADMDFIEAHATGTQAGDKVEAESIAEVFCTQKRSPLKIGSVKSNLGHTENASGTFVFLTFIFPAFPYHINEL
jgi:fatty acid synthase